MRQAGATLRQASFVVGWLSLTVGACSPPAPPISSDSAADQTQVQVGQIVPGPGSLSQGTSQGGIVAGTGNTVGSVPGVPSLQNIALTLSVASAAAPDLCLSVPDLSSSQTALVLRSCAADPLQKWVLVNGLLQSNKGGCLTIDPTQNNSATVTACDVNNIHQQVSWAGGQLTSFAVSSTQMVLQVTTSPATTTSIVNFSPFDASRITQQRWHLADQSHDSSQKLVQHGVSVAILEKSGTCLTSADGLQYAACVPGDSNQMWSLTSNGYVRNEGANRCLGLNGTAAGMVDCNPGPSVAWIVRGGVLVSNAGTCLDAEGSSVALKTCDLSTSRHFLIGLSRGL